MLFLAASLSHDRQHDRNCGGADLIVWVLQAEYGLSDDFDPAQLQVDLCIKYLMNRGLSMLKFSALETDCPLIVQWKWSSGLLADG
jgi:hypothetical protein